MPEQTSPATERDALTIAIVSRTVFYLPVWIAMRRGYFSDEGLEATVEVFDNAEQINAALKDGRVNVAISTPESIMVDALQGGPLRVVAGCAGRLPHFVITQPSIRSLADLRGKTIGVLSDQEGTTHLVPEVTRRAGLLPQDYTVKAVGGAPTRWKLLKAGEIDAGLQPFPLSYEAEAAGFNNLGALVDFVPDWQFTSVNVDSRWAASHRSVLVRTLRAMQRGLNEIATHPHEAAEIAAQEMNTTQPLAARALAEAARLGILTPDQSISVPGLARVHEALVAAKLIDDAPFDLTRVAIDTVLPESRM